MSPTVSIPKGAKGIHFVLKQVKLEGVTAFAPEQLADIYAPYIGKDITLDIAYMMAGGITERYRSNGYFLSLAYVPNQRVKGGVITLKVVEGYVGMVEMDDALRDQYVVRSYIDHLLRQKPLKRQTMESFLLRLNDLPGYSFRAVLSLLDHAEEGAVKLTLVPAKKDGKGQISFDNFSSRYLNPNEVSASYARSLLPMQQTTVSGLTSLPPHQLKYAALDHTVVIAPDVTLGASASTTTAHPGFTLEPFDINSTSTFLSTSLTYQWIRQRQQNLALKLTLDGRDTSSDLLNTPFTRDRIRALRANATYDSSDGWNGYNVASLTLSQGLSIFGSSNKGDLNLSRAEATPDFTKAELSLTRLQAITGDWSLLASASAQHASGPLYSSEEFGYGGQAFGRAYDSSEITGDHGVSGSLELRYAGFGDWHPVGISPYAFYDIGTVWNEDPAQPGRESGASAGLGVRANGPVGITGNFGLAWPLTRQIGAPIYGQGSKDPRILLQIGQEF